MMTFFYGNIKIFYFFYFYFFSQNLLFYSFRLKIIIVHWKMNQQQEKAILVEFIGSFLFIFVIAFAAFNFKGEKPTTNYAPLWIGVALAIVIYQFGGHSGGHFNPAVTIAASYANGWKDEYWAYFVAQIVGGILAVLFVRHCFMKR